MDGFDYPANTLPTPGYSRKDHNTAQDDDCCVGVIGDIKFSRNGGYDYTSIRFIGEPQSTSTHFTKVIWLRQPLFEAYKSQSVIKIHTRDCTKVSTPFEGFSVIERNYNQPDSVNRPDRRIPLPKDFRMECIGKIIYIGYFTGVTPTGKGSHSPAQVTVIELSTSPIKYFILYELYREMLMHAFYDEMYVELPSDGCHNPNDPSTDTIRFYLDNPIKTYMQH